MNKKKGQGLPVNIVVMLILGIIIFGLGMGLFSKISSKGEDIVDDLNSKIKSDIANLECDGEDWICSPSYKMENNAVGKFSIFIANRGDTTKDFTITFGDAIKPPYSIEKEGCNADIYYPTTDISVRSGESAQMPFIVQNLKVKGKCSLVTTATLSTSGEGDGEKTSVIVRIG